MKIKVLAELKKSEAARSDSPLRLLLAFLGDRKQHILKAFGHLWEGRAEI